MIDTSAGNDSPGSARLGYHGGNLDAARACFPAAPLPWIDLSTGINAQPYPMPVIPDAAWQRLPLQADIARLERIATCAYGAIDPATVVSAPGTQALIQQLPHVLKARKVGIVGFTYAEHARVWRDAGADVSQLEPGISASGCDAIVVVNPNNPDGHLTRVEDVLALAEPGATLIVDEAFMDAIRPSQSLIPHLPKADAIVLRSFGKIYGLAGLRLGFAAASPELAARLRQALGPWAISGAAVEAGSRALADAAWLAQAIADLELAAQRLDILLRSSGFSILGGTPLFRLASHGRAGTLFSQLAQAGILVRPFPHKPHWLRFGIPMQEHVWLRLAAALQN